MNCTVKGGDVKELKFRFKFSLCFWRRCRGELIHEGNLVGHEFCM